MDKIEMKFCPIEANKSLSGSADVYSINIMAGFNGPYATFYLNDNILSNSITLYEKDHWYTEHISKMIP